MAKHPRFEITKDTKGKFRFNLTAKNGQVVLSSQGYASKTSCKNGIASVRRNSSDDSLFDRKKAKDGKAYFNLLAKNRQVIGTSQRYGTTASMENGIKSVSANAATAELHEG